ncbi:sodium:solute symporter family protein [Halorubrum sp. GN11_10-6_MGM]|uniref:sodium:solute symporter family protein n=1 Tax=Halorubrum sp. GN11_10-6_MGM TaxID=2518112 RepID=UPI0010F4B68E|nr:sodium:solute symporter family protein [Halorubrum sp. GN11_10-6_MGM]TKX73883.1 sodium:solute symporter family protein [Halorubrum sp. GN11_10-6_MGM]
MTPLKLYLWVGLGLFLVVVAGLAYLGWKRTNTMSDFAIASESLGPYVLGAAFAATFFSAATFVGYVGWSYTAGLSNLWLFLALIGASPVALILFAKRVREINVDQHSLSLPDWLGSFYDSQFIRVWAAIAVMFNLFYIAAQLDAGALFFTTLLGFSKEIGLTIITVLVVLYVMAGATFADIYTDAVQAVLMAIMGVLVFVSAFWTIGGGPIGTFTHIGAEMNAMDPALTKPTNPDSSVFYSAFAIIALFILEFAFAAQPQLFNKVLAISNPSDLRKMIVTYVSLTLAFILTIFGGFYLLVLDSSLEVADQAIFVYAMDYFPAIVAAFLGLVILSAALSTTDGIFIVLSTAVANDVFLKFLVGEDYIEMDADRADRVSKYIAQAVVLLVGAIAYYIALTAPFNIGELIWVGISGVAAATVPPIMVGIYFPNFVTRKAAIASMVVGVLGYGVITTVSNAPSVFVRGTYALVLSTAVMIAVSAVTAQEDGVAEIGADTTTGGD